MKMKNKIKNRAVICLHMKNGIHLHMSIIAGFVAQLKAKGLGLLAFAVMSSTGLSSVGYNGYGFTWRAKSTESSQEVILCFRNTFNQTWKGMFLFENEEKVEVNFKKRHHLIFQEGGLPEGTEVVYKCDGKVLQRGYKKGHKIHCECCKKEISPSLFEGHAGMATRKKPYNNIFLSDGRSLHEYANSLKINSEQMLKENDALCRVCEKSGDLLSCEGCPRSFHKECITEPVLPMEKWFCTYCKKSMGQRPNANAKRRIQITNSLDKREVVACVLCRACDFSDNGFSDRTVIVCDQCEKEYHIGCLRVHKDIKLEQLPHGNWFCTLDCEELHDVLNALTTIEEPVPCNEDGTTNRDVKWIICRGKDASEDNRLLLTQAVRIFHECFNPIIDSVTGKDFITSMAFGLQMGASDFSGVHCAMLIINSKVITAGLFRVFGYEFAELPLVATDEPNQRKGYFQLFVLCFERLLSYLQVKKLVVPAAEKTQAMWKNKFGFKKVKSMQLREYQQDHTSMVSFLGTSLLEKGVPEVQRTFKNDGIFSERKATKKRQRCIRNNRVASSSVDHQNSANELPEQNAPEQSFLKIKEENINLRQRVFDLERELVHVKNELETTQRKLEKSEYLKSYL